MPSLRLLGIELVSAVGDALREQFRSWVAPGPGLAAYHDAECSRQVRRACRLLGRAYPLLTIQPEKESVDE